MCALPKGYRKNLNIVNQTEGPERRQGYLDDIDYKGTYLPKGVDYEDIDKNFIKFVDEGLNLIIGDANVPVVLLTIQRWAEFSQTWEFTDEKKNTKFPFITIVRKPDIQVGTNQAGNWNIPGIKLYTYIKVPTLEGGRTGVDVYKIPQPTSVDVTYEVKLFCNRMKDLNEFNKIIQNTFQSRQHYIKINEHPMPIHLELIGDESQIEDFDSRRFYVQNFEMKILAYILDEKDFELIPSINRANIKFKELIGSKMRSGRANYNVKNFDNESVYTFKFKPNSVLEFNFTSQVGIDFYKINNVINITNIKIKINSVLMHDGLIMNDLLKAKVNDIITIIIEGVDSNLEASFNINGKIQTNE